LVPDVQALADQAYARLKQDPRHPSLHFRKVGRYLFSDGSTHPYVDRTKKPIAVRIRNHFSTAPDCPFAWLLAREATGKKATYKRDGSRKALLADPVFKAEYDPAFVRPPWRRRSPDEYSEAVRPR